MGLHNIGAFSIELALRLGKESAKNTQLNHLGVPPQHNLSRLAHLLQVCVKQVIGSRFQSLGNALSIQLQLQNLE